MPLNCSTAPPIFSSITRSSMRIRASGDTSPLLPLPSVRWAICLRPPSTPTCGAWPLSPMASEIEAQTIRWIAEMLGLSHRLRRSVRQRRKHGQHRLLSCCAPGQGRHRRARSRASTALRLRAYCSKETHTWIQKAADISGLGTDAVRWIAVDTDLPHRCCSSCAADRRRSRCRRQAVPGGRQRRNGRHRRRRSAPGARRALPRIRPLVSRGRRLRRRWQPSLPDAPAEFAGLSEADSVAVDPHKWLYAPLEAGCALVRDSAKLRDAFAYHPPYYHFGDEAINYFDLGPQNSRGFRALKVWLALQQVGRDGYVQMISDDIRLSPPSSSRRSRNIHELEAFTQGLSITTFRFMPLRPEGRRRQRGKLSRRI